jgi:hypothetical protein
MKTKYLQLMSEGSLDHGGETHVVVKLPKVHKSDFEKNQIQKF